MKLICLCAFAVCLSAAANAQNAPASPSTDIHTQVPVAPNTAPPADANLPAVVGAPHECKGYFPPDATDVTQGVVTQLRFTVTAEGKVADLKVVRSSGRPDLDDAAVACARNWQYRPATVFGKNVSWPWQAFVQWLDPNPVTPQTIASRALRRDVWNCLWGSPAAQSLPPGFSAPLIVHVKFSTWFADATFDMTQSSGNDAVDKAAMECMRRSPYLSGLEAQSGASPGASLRLAVWK